jgi:alanine dehydrogenase
MAIHIAAHYLQIEEGGRGILVGTVPGVPPATILILGAGSVGRTAAKIAADVGAHVILIDEDIERLREVHVETDGRVVTMTTGEGRLGKFTAIADVVIGAVLIPGGRAPFLVSEAMVRAMKPGSVILDLSIDQGGCVETSRPTSVADPVFRIHDVIHYCVPNMTSNIARTASRAFVSAALPYLIELSTGDLSDALDEDPGLASGLYLYQGQGVHPSLAEAFGLPCVPIEELLGGGA